MADQSAGGAIAAPVPASSPAPTDAPAPADALPDFRKFKHKLKVNDREQELDYDTVLKHAQKGLASDDVFRRAAEKEKKVAALLDRAKGGDLDWLEELAGDEKLTKWAEKKLLKIIERQNMSPEQRELLQERALREKLENEKKTREQQDADMRGESLRHEAAQDLDERIDQAFKARGVSMTPSRIERLAQYLDASLNSTGTLMDADKALDRVMSEIRSDATGLLESMTLAELREFLPKKVLDALRRGDVEDVRAQDPMRRPTQDGQPRKLSDAKVKRMSTDDYFNKLEKKFGG